MRKSNWLVATVAAIAVGALLWLWYFLGFNRIDSPLDLVIAIVWWLVIALVVVAITRAEAKRREKMRTAFVGEGFLYNPETGLITADQGESEVSLLEHTLATRDSRVSKGVGSSSGLWAGRTSPSQMSLSWSNLWE